MSRKPIDQQQPHECRQAIWDEIRRLDTFTQKDLDIRLDASSIRDYLTGLAKAGYLLAASGKNRGQKNTYTLIKDCGVEAPRVRKDGSPVVMGRGRRQMWHAMVILKTFSPRDLAFNASTAEHGVAETEAASYCQLLAAAGYLARRGVNSYALIAGKWTGPHPPQIQRTKQIYDPNLRKVVWSRIDGGAE